MSKDKRNIPKCKVGNCKNNKKYSNDDETLLLSRLILILFEITILDDRWSI